MRSMRVLLVGLCVVALVAASAQASNGKPAKVTRHHKCVVKFHFCADFPYVSGSQDGFKHYVFDSGTSVTGKLDSYSSNLYRSSGYKRLCLKEFDPRCPILETYFIEVIKSKYTDPWTALTSLNEGVKNPHREHYRGNLAVRFTGLYGPVGYAIYHDGLVYYMEEGILLNKRDAHIPKYARSFVESIRFS